MLKSAKLLISLMTVIAALDFSSCPLQAEETTHASSSDKKHKISICAIFKNEAGYLKEWIEYHKLIGVDHFYLYNNDSRDCSSEVLNPYVRDGLVTLINWPDITSAPVDEKTATHWALSTQLPAYEHAAKWEALNETEWLAFLDVEEFLVPINCNSLSQILENYDEYSGIGLSSDFFEAPEVNVFPRKDLLISAVELRDRPVQMVQTSVEKMIIKPDNHTVYTSSPYKCYFEDDKASVKAQKCELRINRYANRSNATQNIRKKREKLRVDNRMLTDRETKELLQIGYAIDDNERAIFKYVPELRKKMGLETGWEFINVNSSH